MIRATSTFGRARLYRPVNGLLWSSAYLIHTAVPASDLMVSRGVRVAAAASGALVLVLSAIGLYGAVALGVGQRRREIGVRMALGAWAEHVVALFYAGGLRLGTALRSE